MKADERVSEVDLEYLRDTLLGYLSDDGYTSLPLSHLSANDVVSLIDELQSRRAAEQAALPAVEEMVVKLDVIADVLAKLPGDLAVGFGRVNGHINHINLFAATADGSGYSFWMQVKPANEKNFALCESIIDIINGCRDLFAVLSEAEEGKEKK